MGIFGALFLVAGAVIGLSAAPALFLYLYHAFPDTWWAELTKIQAFAGASIALFAASLGTIGVLLTIWNQRRNLDKQLSAQRHEQDRSRIFERQHLASAFIGEISVIISVFENSPIRQALDDLRTAPGEMQVGSQPRLIVRARYYESNPGNVGYFSKQLPQELTEFFSRFETIRVNMDRYTEYASQGTLTASHAIRTLEYIVESLNYCVARGRALTTQLEAIRDEKVD
jgi:hypothetical protein